MKPIDESYIFYTGVLELTDMIRNDEIPRDEFATYVKKKVENEICGECLGSGAEDYEMVNWKLFKIPCVFCKGTGEVKEKHYKSGIRVKYF